MRNAVQNEETDAKSVSGPKGAGPARLVIGVAGGSGSGKTTVVRRIVESIGDDQVLVLEHDRYYRDRNDLRLEERAALNYDHPDSLETDLLVRHLHELRNGRPIEAPVYDFARYLVFMGPAVCPIAKEQAP
jgi:uridine kinase